MHTIERQVTHLARLVDDLLDVSRITQGSIELRRRSMSVADLVARALETVDPLIRHKRHKVSTAAQSLEPVRECRSGSTGAVPGQCAHQRSQVHRAGGLIHVETREEAGEAIISVNDNGVGIAPELLPDIFDLFVQGERTLDRSQGGLGIGLSLVKRLIEMHGGSVRIVSDGERLGTTCELRLPLINGLVAATPDVETPETRSRRILVVDDNEDAANTLAMILKLEGHDVETAYSGAEAFARIDIFQPEIVLLDIGLPNLDGYQVAERMRRQPNLREPAAGGDYGLWTGCRSAANPGSRFRRASRETGRFRGS